MKKRFPKRNAGHVIGIDQTQTNRTNTVPARALNNYELDIQTGIVPPEITYEEWRNTFKGNKGDQGDKMTYQDLTAEDIIDLSQKINVNAQRIPAVAPGSLPAGPSGQTRYMEVTAVGSWTYGGNTFTNADGYKTTIWWNGTTWSNAGSAKIKGDNGLDGVNGNALATEWAGTSADAGLTYPMIRAYQGKLYRVKSGQTTLATDLPTGSKYEPIGGSYFYLNTSLICDFQSSEINTATTTTNTKISASGFKSALNIDISNYTQEGETLLKYVSSINVTSIPTNSAVVLVIDKDNNIQVLQSFKVGDALREELYYTIPQGAKTISLTFGRAVSVLDSYAELHHNANVVDALGNYDVHTRVNGKTYVYVNSSGFVTTDSTRESIRSSAFVDVRGVDYILYTGKAYGNMCAIVGTDVNNWNVANQIMLLGAGTYKNYKVRIPKGVNYLMFFGLHTPTEVDYYPAIFTNKKEIETISAKPIAHWEFTEESAPYYSEGGKYPLVVGGANAPTRVSTNTKGGGLSFTGNQYLKLPFEQTDELNVGKYANKVTVVAWVKRLSSFADSNSFVAGMWRENDNNPSRMYGMFTSLSTYSAVNRVIGHISRYGGASPGLIYSRDLSSSGEAIKYDKYEMLAITYDGEQVISYLNGLADSSTAYEEPNTGTTGVGLRYDKNPYKFNLGLNHNSFSDFTVGAVELTSGMGNFFKGEIGEVMVFNKALSADELMRLHLKKSNENNVFRFDFNYSNGGTYAKNLNIRVRGWDNYIGDSAFNYVASNLQGDNSFYIEKTTTSVRGYAGLKTIADQEQSLFFKALISELPLNFVSLINFDLNNTGVVPCKFALKIKGVGWVVTNDDFTHTGVASTAPAVATIESFTVDLTTATWNILEVIPNAKMQLTTEDYELKPNDIAESFGVYFYDSTDIDNIVRVVSVDFQK